MSEANDARAPVFERIRRACAHVAGRARSVRIDHERIAQRAPLWAKAAPAPGLDPAHHHRGDDASTLAFVLTLDAINFGSGWFPLLDKRPGLSGYRTLASALSLKFDRDGPWDASALCRLRADDCARTFGQQGAAAGVGELMELFARGLRDLGQHLLDHYDGRFEGPVVRAGGSAARLVEDLARMPLYRDVSFYTGREVPFYKRAQITASDLAAAFGERGPGRFEDLEELTIFADNLVPHVLRHEGVLHYSPELERHIEAGRLLEAGSPEEVEIRACALHAVERVVAAARADGHTTSARRLDTWLWTRGQDPLRKATPRHRSRTCWY